MSEDSEQSAIPVEEAATDDAPTVDEVLQRQEIEHPEQARTSTLPAATTEEAAIQDAGGEVVGREADGAPDIEGPNST